MAELGKRFRERLVPPPVFGKVVAGRLRKIKESNGQQVSSVDQIDFPSVSSQEIERTWDVVNPGPPYLTGGNFMNLKALLPQFTVKGVGSYRSIPWGEPGGPFIYYYDGGFVNPSFGADPIPMSRYENIGIDSPPHPTLIPVANANCAEVYKKLRPQLAKAGLAVALAEARDVPRMLQATSKAFHESWKALGGKTTPILQQPKGLSEDFLNYQFGWVPFINDIYKFCDVAISGQVYIDEVTRNNNTWVKRVRAIQDEETDTLITRNYTIGCFPTGGKILSMMEDVNVNGNNCKAHYELREIIKTHVWCEGSFKYYRPEFDHNLSSYDDNMTQIQRYLTLYGARLNPSVVYQATPWTWLIDWFADIGDHIDRATDWAYDSMVSKYMYLMHHHLREFKFIQTCHFLDGAKTFEWSRFSEAKQRQKADNPYNFCLSWQNLTPRQLAILAALGITRGSSIARNG